jgi:hypothetical protein
MEPVSALPGGRPPVGQTPSVLKIRLKKLLRGQIPVQLQIGTETAEQAHAETAQEEKVKTPFQGAASPYFSLKLIIFLFTGKNELKQEMARNGRILTLYLSLVSLTCYTAKFNHLLSASTGDREGS